MLAAASFSGAGTGAATGWTTGSGVGSAMTWAEATAGAGWAWEQATSETTGTARMLTNLILTLEWLVSSGAWMREQRQCQARDRQPAGLPTDATSGCRIRGIGVAPPHSPESISDGLRSITAGTAPAVR